MEIQNSDVQARMGGIGVMIQKIIGAMTMCISVSLLGVWLCVRIRQSNMGSFDTFAACACVVIVTAVVTMFLFYIDEILADIRQDNVKR